MERDNKALIHELTKCYRNNKYDDNIRLLLRDAADTIRSLTARSEMLENVIKEKGHFNENTG